MVRVMVDREHRKLRVVHGRRHCQRIAVAWLAVGAALTVACGSSNRSAPVRERAQIRVAAAADLNAALTDLLPRFSNAHAVDVTVSYGSSGTFFAQILNGAPFDVFLSADIQYPRQLAERGLTAPGGEFAYGIGRLVLWTPNALALDTRKKGLRALTDRDVRHIAVANPDHAPYGRAAIAALKSSGVYDGVQSKLVFGENVAQTLQFAQSGSADAALVALALALAPSARDAGRYVEVPSDSYPAIEQGGAILASSTAIAAANEFRAFLTGDDGRAILQQFGFGLPPR